MNLKMEKSKPSYLEALAEVEAIINRLNRNPLDVDALRGEIARAEKLLAHCRERLAAAEG